MQGLDPLTRQCIYSTPCGWCAKWDKKCDKKIGLEIMPVLKMPDQVAENIIEDVKNRMYESCGVSEDLIKKDNGLETINQAIDEIKLLETILKTEKYPDSVYNSFRKEVCDYCFDYISKQCLRSQMDIVECPKFENYFEVKENNK